MSQPVPKGEYTTEDAKQHLSLLLTLMKIDKVYFIDDSLSKEPDINEFLGLIRSINANDNLEIIKKGLPFIQYDSDLDIFVDNIQTQWEEMLPVEKIKCFEIAYEILDRKEEYTNINVSSVLQSYFNEGVLVLKTPTEWEAYFETFIPNNENIVALFDQDLSKEEGKYITKQGQDLILDVKKKGYESNIFTALFTFKIQKLDEEIETRTKIIHEFQKQDEVISSADFFVFTKDRLHKPHLLADAIKKMFLNQYCERIKNETIAIARTAFDETITVLETLDTYSFDLAVLKSSYKEGIWEVETLLRIINLYQEDFIKNRMIKDEYLLKTNGDFEKAHTISKLFNIPLSDNIATSPYSEPIQLRQKEIYEFGQVINNLHKPLENGDIFELIFEDDSKGTYILIAQECDLMIRNQGDKKGNRSAKNSVLLKVDEIPMVDVKKFKWKNDNYKIEYWGDDLKQTASINFTESLNVDLSILDMVSFNEEGKAILNLSNENIRLGHFSSSLKARYTFIIDTFKSSLDNLFQLISKLNMEESDVEIEATLINNLSQKVDRKSVV